MDIEQFYEADERRRRSEEIELGTEWTDAQRVRYELSWVAETGELYVMCEPTGRVAEDLFGDIYNAGVALGAVTVAVVGWVPDRDRLESVLAGWQDAMPQPSSMSWLVGRLKDAGVPTSPPAA